jgi:hypothetical protein
MLKEINAKLGERKETRLSDCFERTEYLEGMSNPEFLPPKKSRRNWPIIVLAVIVGLWFIGNLSSEFGILNKVALVALHSFFITL